MDRGRVDGVIEAETAEAEAEPSLDTLRRALSDEERARLAIDAWEPSLLRCLLSAWGRLDTDEEV